MSTLFANPALRLRWILKNPDSFSKNKIHEELLFWELFSLEFFVHKNK